MVGGDHTSFRACKSPKLLLAILPFTSICFQPLKLSAATAGNQHPCSLLAGCVTGGRNCVEVADISAEGDA